MGDHDDHRKRVYNRFLREGLAGFEEHNALEFLLFLAKARGDTNCLAHALIRHFGSLAAVLDASVEELQEIPGVGYTSAVALTFIPQMCAYYLANKRDKSVPLDSVAAAGSFFMPEFFGKTHEQCYIAALDDKRRVLRCVCISDGLANATALSVAKIVTEATRCHATGIILAHNHPRGITMPSAGDLAATREIIRALRLVNIELVDHLIFNDDDYLSFADTHYLTLVQKQADKL